MGELMEMGETQTEMENQQPSTNQQTEGFDQARQRMGMRLE